MDKKLPENFSNQQYSFDDVIVDPESNLLTKNGSAQRVKPKIILLLNYFAGHAKQVVSRQELMTAIWPNVVVSDEVVTQAIFTLRNALGDDVKRPKYIETIPKKGYRFLIEAKAVSSQKTHNPWPLTIGSVIATVALVLIIAVNFNASSSPEIEEILPFTNTTGSEYDFALDPGERNLAYVHKNQAQNRLIVKNIASGDIDIRADDGWDKRSPRWLDDTTLIYSRCNSDQCQLVRQYGQQPDDIIYRTENLLHHLEVVQGQQPMVIFSEQQSQETTLLKSLNLFNGQVTGIGERFAPLPKQALRPTYVADADMLYAVGINALKPSVYGFDFSTGEHLFTLDEFDKISSLASGLGKHQLLLTGVKDGTRGIWLVNTTTDQVELLLRTSGAELIHNAIGSKVNDTVYYSTSLVNADIAQLSYQGVSTDLAALNSDALELNATFLENTSTILFVSNRSGYHELWLYDADKRQSRQITQLKSLSMGRPVPSRNGQFVAVVYKSTKLTLAVIDIHSGAVMSSLELPELKFPLAWSEDDQYIYVSEHLSAINLFKYDRKTLSHSLVKHNAGLFALETNPGRSLITFDYQQNAFVELDLRQGTYRPITAKVTDSQYLFPGQVLLRQDSIEIAKTQDKQLTVVNYPRLDSNGETQPPQHLPLGNYWTFSIDANGRHLLVATQKQRRGEIMSMKLKL